MMVMLVNCTQETADIKSYRSSLKQGLGQAYIAQGSKRKETHLPQAAGTQIGPTLVYLEIQDKGYEVVGRSRRDFELGFGG